MRRINAACCYRRRTYRSLSVCLCVGRTSKLSNTAEPMEMMLWAWAAPCGPREPCESHLDDPVSAAAAAIMLVELHFKGSQEMKRPWRLLKVIGSYSSGHISPVYITYTDHKRAMSVVIGRSNATHALWTHTPWGRKKNQFSFACIFF